MSGEVDKELVKIGLHIQRTRCYLGMTTEELAKQFSMCRATIGKIERGLYHPQTAQPDSSSKNLESGPIRPNQLNPNASHRLGYYYKNSKK